MKGDDVELIYPLSPMQQAMLFHSLYAPGSGVYVVQVSLQLVGRLDVDAFERAWRAILERHGILRTAFHWEGLEKPVQVVHRQVELPMVRECWRGLSAAARRERLTAYLDADRERGFEVSEAPLMRLALFELDAGAHQLVWSQHHLLLDGWSQGLLFKDLFSAYGALVGGGEPALGRPRSYRDYVSWLKRQDLAEAEALWRRSLAGFARPTYLTATAAGAAATDYRASRLRELRLSAAATTAVQEMAKRRRLTLNTVVQGAWAVLLSRASGERDVVFGSTVSGRPAELSGAESIVGLFINTLPVRVEVRPRERLAPWLGTLQERQVELRRYEHTPLLDVQRWSELPAGVALFDHLLAFESYPLDRALAGLLPDLSIEEVAVNELTNYPANLVVVPGAELSLALLHDAERLDGAAAERLLGHLALLLEAFVVDPEGVLEDLPSLTVSERHQLLLEWNDTWAPDPVPTSIQSLFEAWAALRPEAPALVGPGWEISYGELERRSNQVAHLLRRQGVGPGDWVGVRMRRGPQVVAGLLGILKAGAAYAPLEPDWPAERCAYILGTLSASCLLTDRTLLRSSQELQWCLPDLSHLVCLDEPGLRVEPEAVDREAVAGFWDQLAEWAEDRVGAGGFVSSYTGRRFSEAEIDEYVERVMSLAEPYLSPASRVLEIGCGSGLIGFELAARAARYVGLDPSASTQAKNRQEANRCGLTNVDLVTGFGHELGDLPSGSFDLVVLASAAQFFPGYAYLERVVEEALRLLAPGGALLVADVMDMRRREDFRRSLEEYRLRHRGEVGVRTRVLLGPELYVDEDFFADLAADLPGLGDVWVLHREHGFDNELRFRYDVVLEKAGSPRQARGERRKRVWAGGWVARQEESAPPPIPATVDPIAYVIFTSGSTGVPKGVMVRHRPVVHLIDWVNRTFGVGAGDRLLFLTSLCFDLSVYDVFGTLAAGGSIRVATDEEVRDPQALVRVLASEPITFWDSAPAAVQQLAPWFPAAGGAGQESLRRVFLSGDWIPLALPGVVRASFPRARVIALGGATEATVWSNFFPVEEVAPSWPSIPYGRPMELARYHVLDRELAPCAVGVTGDLYIGGPCLATGYLDAVQTAERFLPDLLGEEPGLRLYRTGDLARYRLDGNLQFLGRSDTQVKIRGFRIEQGEVEAVLSRHPELRQAVVAVCEDRPGDRRLVAYVVPLAATGPATAELAAYARERLPEPMVPAAFMVLSSLPVTANGKLDRAALPAPKLERDGDAAFEVPRGPVEELVAGIWEEVLGLERVGVKDNFFHLGGHSLVATQVTSRLRDAFGVELPVRRLFEAPTVAALARAVEQALRAGASSSSPPLRPVPRTRALPLSFAQQRLWLIHQLEPSSPAYNLASAYHVSGELDVPALAASLLELVQRHEVLRTVFQTRDEGPVQVIQEAGASALVQVDLSGLDEPRREAELARRVTEEALVPFDLARGPLLRATLLMLSQEAGEEERAEDHAILLTLHHVAGDAWSMGVLLRELSALYAARRERRSSPLPPMPVQYGDYAVWQREWLSGEVLEAEVAHWCERLDGAPPVLDLVTDRPRPSVQSFRGSSRPFRVAKEVAADLHGLCRREGATPFMVLLGAFATLLSRTTGAEDLSLGTPIAGRGRLETEALIGFFVNTLVLRCDLSGDPTFGELVGRLRGVVLEAHAHQDLPFELLVEALQPQRSLSHTPLFQVMVNFLALPDAGGVFPGLEWRSITAERRRVHFDLELTGEARGGLGGRLEYRSELFEAATMARMLAHLENLLAAAVAGPERPLEELPLLAAAEAQVLLHEWNDTAAALPASCFPALFAEQAARIPAAIAAVCDGQALSYAELHARVRGLAQQVRALTMPLPAPRLPAVVAVLAHRGLDLLIALAGLLEAGAIYLPLEPEQPAQRQAQVLRQSGALAVLAAADQMPALVAALASMALADRPRVLPLARVVRGVGAEGAAMAAAGEPPPLVAHDLAYMIFTSGSTGVPKGVLIEHRGMLNHLHAKIEALSLGAADVVAQTASQCFDISIWQLLAPLLVGGRVAIYPDAVALDPERLAARCAEDGISILETVPSLLRLMLEAVERGDAGDSAFAALRWLIPTGEALPPELCTRWLAAYPGVPLLNAYGPTECSDDVAHHVIANPPAEAATRVPIGRALRNTRLYVLNPSGGLAPVGVAGELCVGGAGVGQGYRSAALRTAASFMPDPFAGAAVGTRLYRTGDLARRLPDGSLDFLGRIDHQVKVRGFRIELGEIESVLSSHPEVRECVVSARREGDEDARLVAYVVAATEGTPPSSGLLRAHLKASLPEPMVPSAFVFLLSMPLTSNGKVDRRALPSPREEVGKEMSPIAPRTPVEELLVGIWQEVLGRKQIGVEDDFFILDGNSLRATQVVSRLRRAFAVEVPVRRLFEAPTVAELARVVEEALRAGKGPAAPPSVPPIVRMPRDFPLPLSFAQQRLWFIHQLAPSSPAYNLASAHRVSGRLDVRALSASFAELVRRHEVLRTILLAGDGGPVQVVKEPGRSVLARVDLRGLDEARREAELARRVAVEALSPFDLARGPLRAALVLLAEDEHAVLLNLHHVAGDAWSMSVLLREVSALYEAFRQSRPSPLPALPVQYGDYAAWQRGWLTGAVLEEEVAHWRARLAGAPPLLDLPTDRPRPAVQAVRGGSHAFVVEADLATALHGLARRRGATVFMLLLSAFEALLWRWTGQSDLALGMPIAGRDRLETEGLIGFFVNTLVLRGDLAGHPTFVELLNRVRPVVLEAYGHQDLPFELLVEALQPRRSLSRTPLFQVMVSFITPPGPGDTFPGLIWRRISIAQQAVQLDLLLAWEERQSLSGRLEYRADLFDGATALRLVGHLEALLAGAVALPDRPLAELPLLTAAQQQQSVAEWGGAGETYAPETLDRRFATQARRRAAEPAVVMGGKSLSYADLDRRTNRLARRLRLLGVGPEVVVGICLERSPRLVEAVLAVLKAGGAYLPLDPAYPRERLAFMLADARAAVVVSEERLLATLPPAGAAAVLLDAKDLDEEDDAPLESGVVAESLAYVIYTSGSTGRPRGVLVTHGDISRLLSATRSCFDFGPDDVWTLFHSYAFDFSVWEIWGALAHGGRLVVVPYWVSRSPERFHNLLAAEGVTVLNQTPSAFRQLMAAEATPGIPRELALRWVIFGGEALDCGSLGPWVERHGAWRPRLVNMYGITETTVHVTWRPISEADVLGDLQGKAGSRIGRPLPDQTLRVLGRDLDLPLPGAAGELCVGGAGLARGYLGRPELTAERFVPDPWGGAPGARLYRSGDLGRRSGDGDVEYLGRIDQQVKVRGFRIELGEIESALMAHADVRECVVEVLPDALGESGLVAWVVPAIAGHPPPWKMLRQHLHASLPEPMVPSAFVALASLPLTVNGKVDRQALPSPEKGRSGEESYEAPRTPVEEVLVGIWQELLGRESIGVRDDFFSLGGHSILATRVLLRVATTFAVEVPVRRLFEEPTVAGLAAQILAAEGIAGRSEKIARVLVRLKTMSAADKESLRLSLRDVPG